MIAQEAWDEFLETATANGSTENGAIDLYDIDGMVQAAHSLFKMADIAAADLARVTAEREETQTQVGDWIVRTDEANVRADAAEAKLAERDAEIARLRDAATAWQAFKDAHTVTDHWASVDRLDRALLNKEPTP